MATIRSTVVPLALIAWAVVAWAEPVSAQTVASISVSPSTSSPGQIVVFSGSILTTGPSGCAAGSPVTLTAMTALFPSAGFGPQVQRAASGSFSVTYTIPSTTPVGSYSVGMRCGGGNVGVFTTLDVASAPVSGATTTPTGMPWSGSRPYIAGIAGIGIALLGLGCIQRRRTVQSVDRRDRRSES